MTLTDMPPATPSCTVATVLKSQLRDGDMVARYGGEEFLIALPKVGRASGPVRLPNGCGGESRSIQPISDGGTIVRVTISVGAGAVDPQLSRNQPNDLRRAADNALYRAKNLRAATRSKSPFLTISWRHRNAAPRPAHAALDKSA